jgi:hypothetical protein
VYFAFGVRSVGQQLLGSRILSPISCLLYSVSCILSPVFCILYSVFCILYSVFRLPSPWPSALQQTSKRSSVQNNILTRQVTRILAADECYKSAELFRTAKASSRNAAQCSTRFLFNRVPRRRSSELEILAKPRGNKLIG